MDWAALITWILTAGGGFVLLAIGCAKAGCSRGRWRVVPREAHLRASLLVLLDSHRKPAGCRWLRLRLRADPRLRQPRAAAVERRHPAGVVELEQRAVTAPGREVLLPLAERRYAVDDVSVHRCAAPTFVPEPERVAELVHEHPDHVQPIGAASTPDDRRAEAAAGAVARERESRRRRCAVAA
jgi:hypothetical protein